MSESQDLPQDEEKASNGYQDAINTDPTKFKIEKKPVAFLSNLIDFVKTIFSIREELISYSHVVKEVKDGIAVQGYNVWILMCSIAIASVGLNVNSTAVIVGAMLISPLMGPIRGIGFGVGINDFTMIMRSLKNLGITVGVSLGVSFLYFLISPIDTITEQLFIRTEPTFLDVVIAFFGGLAGVMAVVNGKNDTVIPGVAIATALMPPLCTAGYGLAVGNLNFFLGALYLFVINSVLISLSTLIVVRYFNFPKREYVDPKIERKVKTYIIAFMVVVVIGPSGYLFYKMAQKTIFENNANDFIAKVIRPNTVGKVSSTIVINSDSAYIDVVIQGAIVSEQTKALWLKQKPDYDLKENVGINIYQDGDYKTFFDQKLKDVLANNVGSKDLLNMIKERDFKITELMDKLEKIRTGNQTKSIINMQELIQDFKIDYPQCVNISINQAYTTNNLGVPDTNYTVSVRFGPDVSVQNQNLIKERLADKLKLKLKQRDYTKQDSIPVYTF